MARDIEGSPGALAVRSQATSYQASAIRLCGQKVVEEAATHLPGFTRRPIRSRRVFPATWSMCSATFSRSSPRAVSKPSLTARDLHWRSQFGRRMRPLAGACWRSSRLCPGHGRASRRAPGCRNAPVLVTRYGPVDYPDDDALDLQIVLGFHLQRRVRGVGRWVGPLLDPRDALPLPGWLAGTLSSKSTCLLTGSGS
jgi:hypothetical protein